MPKCSDCKFFEIDTDQPVRGLCRRFPPIAQMELRTTEDGKVMMLPFANAPLTLSGAWCGEFVIKLDTGLMAGAA